VQGDTEHKGRRTSPARGGPGNRSGVLQQLELETIQLGEGREDLSVPVEFLIAFTRCLLRLSPSSDLFAIASMSARREVPISDKQMRLFLKAVRGEVKKSPWPKDFFS
jgi:hypothetical protein